MLDIHTEKGKESLLHEQEMIAIVQRYAPAHRFIQTPKEYAADVDGVVTKDNSIVAIFETKCRNMTHGELTLSHSNEWLISYDKLTKGARLAKAFQVPFIGYLYLIPDKTVLSVVLADKDGNLMPKVQLQRTETQRSCNGGAVTRTNAYVSMAGSKVFA